LNLTTLEIVLIAIAILLFLTHIISFVIFIYWNLSQSRRRSCPCWHRPHRRLCSVVCLLVITKSCAKPIELPFGLSTQVVPRNHVLGRGARILAPWEGVTYFGEGGISRLIVKNRECPATAVTRPFTVSIAATC